MSHYQVFFIFFLIIVIVERVWETFFANKSQSRGIVFSKWTLWALTFVYGVIILSTLIEFFSIPRKINYGISAIGFLFFAVALFGRNYSIKSLGIFHSINIEIKKGHKIVTDGPYKYLRHPYYASIVLEVLGLPLISNSFYTFCLALVAYIPLVFVRIYLEECTMKEKIGVVFLNYKSKVNAFFPFKKTEHKK